MKFVTTSLKQFVKNRTNTQYVESVATASRHFHGRPRPIALNFFLFSYVFLLGFFLVSIA